MSCIMLLLGIVLAIAALVIFYKKKEFHKDWIYYVVVSLLVALVLEVCTFNYSAFIFHGKNAQLKEYTISTGLNQNPEATMALTETGVAASGLSEYNYDLELHDLNTEVKDLYIKPTTGPEKITANILYMDDVFEGYVGTDVEKYVIVKDVEASQHIKLHFAGKTKAIKITLKSEGLELNNLQVKVNSGIPFMFNIYRLLCVFGALLVTLLIYKNRKMKFVGKSQRFVRRFAIITLLVVESLFLIFVSKSQYSVDNVLEEVNTLDPGSMDQYHQLALALSQGKVDLTNLTKESASKDRTEIEYLQSLKDPYMPTTRDITKHRWDEAYYNGHYYTYYGIVPAAFVYLPVYLITGKMLSSRVMTMILGIIISMLIALLVYCIARRRKNVGMWTVLGLMAGGFSVSFVTACMKGSKFYEVSPMSAVALSLGGLILIYEAFKKNKVKVLPLVLGGLFMALAIGCKPTAIFAGIIALPIILNGFANIGKVTIKQTKDNKFKQYFANIFNKVNVKQIIYLLIPIAVVGIGLMAYNFARFGSPTDFGVNYQLSVYNVKYFKMTDLSRLPTVIYNGLLALPRFTSEFPFVHPVNDCTGYSGYIFRMSGVGLIAFPMLWGLVMLPWSLKRGTKKMGQRAFAVMGLIVGLLLCFMTIAKGGSSMRYSFDFAWPFIIPMIYVYLDLDEYSRKKKIFKYVFVCIMVLVIATALMNVLLNLAPEWNDAPNTNPTRYYSIYHTVMFWK